MRFILVDEILEMTPGKTIRALKKISEEEDYFKDHFPGFPVVPGVLLTEMMAQTAGKCLDAEKTHDGKAMLAKIMSANFNSWVTPGQAALISAEIKTSREKYATALCSIEVDGKKVCKAELFFSFAPYENFAPDYVDEVLEDYWEKQSLKANGERIEEKS